MNAYSKELRLSMLAAINQGEHRQEIAPFGDVPGDHKMLREAPTGDRRGGLQAPTGVPTIGKAAE